MWFMVFAVGGKTLIQLDFLLHQEQIAREQCEERFVENSCCQGHCVLKKKLDAVETPAESSGEERNIPVMPELLWAPLTAESFSFATESIRILRFRAVSDEIFKGFTLPIEKPPRKRIVFQAV